MSSPDLALAESVSTTNAYYFILIYILILIYCCFGLAVVCDVYFVPALQKLSYAYNLPPDIAGSTLMALGASIPELFASLIGVFVTKDDIGTGSIIGSSCFNLIAVPAACAFVASATFNQKLIINPMPVIRNSAFYGITILVLLLIIKDNRVDIPEAIILLLFFVMYVALMIFSAKSIKKNSTTTTSSQDSYPTDNSISADSAIAESDSDTSPRLRNPSLTNHSDCYRNYNNLTKSCAHNKGFNENSPTLAYSDKAAARYHQQDTYSSTFYEKQPFYSSQCSLNDLPIVDGGSLKKYKYASETTPLVTAFYYPQLDNNDRPTLYQHMSNDMMLDMRGSELDPSSRSYSTTNIDCTGLGLAIKNSTCLAKSGVAGLSEVDGRIRAQMEFKCYTEIGKDVEENENWLSSRWILIPMLPLTLSMKVLTPCKFKTTLWTIWTFFISISLIGALTYVSVWMVHMSSAAIGIPKTIAGMTILAWGTGITELIASIVLIKKTNQADMAICNTIGSNVIDISFCLSVPWLIRAIMNITDGTEPVIHIQSEALPCTAFTLFLAVLMLLLVLKLHNWTLNFKVALWLSLIYIAFVLSAIYLETNFSTSGINFLTRIK